MRNSNHRTPNKRSSHILKHSKSLKPNYIQSNIESLKSLQNTDLGSSENMAVSAYDSPGKSGINNKRKQEERK